MFIPINFMLDCARNGGYSISRFVVTDLESIEAVTQAAQEADAPVIYDIYEPELKDICQPCIELIVQKLGEAIAVPVAIFSDHLKDFDSAKAVIEKGYGGLMIDGSRLPFEENVFTTRMVVELAHQNDVFVEGAIGIIESGREDIDKDYNEILTKPEEAAEFARQTGVDGIAVSVGVRSGFYEGIPEIKYELIRDIKNKISQYLSLHGCSGLPEDVIKKCIKEGFSLTAWATDIRYVFFKTIDEIRKQKGEKFVLPAEILVPARNKMKETIIEKLKQGGSCSKGSQILNEFKIKNPFLDKPFPPGDYIDTSKEFYNPEEISKLTEIISEEIVKRLKLK